MKISEMSVGDIFHAEKHGVVYAVTNGAKIANNFTTVWCVTLVSDTFPVGSICLFDLDSDEEYDIIPHRTVGNYLNVTVNPK